MITRAVRDFDGTTDWWGGPLPHRSAHRAAAAAVRTRLPLPLIGMLLLAWGAAAPARAATTIIDTPVSGPITVNAGDRVEIHPGGSVSTGPIAVTVNAGGELIMFGGSVSGGFGGAGAGVVVDGGTATIYGGDLSGHYGVIVYSGTLTVSGGAIYGPPKGVRVNGGTANISGGSVAGNMFGLEVAGGTANITGGDVFGGDYGVWVDGGTATLSGGSVSGGGLLVSASFATVRGCNLHLAGTTLSGILQDGTALNLPVSLYASDALSLDTGTLQITCPANQTVPATSTAGAVVNYPSPVVSNTCSSPVQVTTVPASGSTFPVGNTPVTCAVTDALGNSSSCSFTVTVLPAADLAVVMTAASGKKSGNPLRVKVGEPVTYTIVVTNSGPHTSDSAALRDILPDSFVFQSATTTQGTVQGPPPGSTGAVSASLGSIAPGGSATVRITGSFSAPKTTIANTVNLSPGITDPNPANNQATVNVIVN